MNLPQPWQLTPVRGKSPYLDDWTNRNVDRDSIEQEIASGKATGYGLRLGIPSGGKLAIDFDGQSAIEMAIEKFGELPTTVTWTSGRPGRYQALFQVPEAYLDRLKNKNISTGVIGDDRKAEAIEFRYTGNQSVLPPSAHPDTDGYKWINNPFDTPVAELPQVVIDYLLELIEPKSREKPKRNPLSVSTPEGVPPIPLEKCLTRQHRIDLNGAVKGTIHNTAISLVCDLIGAEEYLKREQISYTGSALELFHDFHDRSDSTKTAEEIDRIFSDIEKDNPDPSCNHHDSDGLRCIIEAWNRKHSNNHELEEDLKHSLELKNGKAPMVFGGELGKLLSIAASNFNIPTEILTFCLLPILASQIDSRTELLINPGTDYRVPAVRWCGLVGDTGSKKSPVLGLLTKALSGQQNELYTEYKANKLAYDAEFRAWKATPPKDRQEEPAPPAPLRDLYFGDFTIEGIILSLSNYPNSAYLLMLDELASFFSAMDAYRGGKGGDRQKWLTIWNSGGIKVNRKSTDTICVPQSSISIVGGIQPQTIANLIGGDNSQQDGLWNRFAFMGLPHNTTEAFTETPGDLREELDKVYRALSGQDTQTHCLSLEAKPLWKAWHDEIEAKTISEPNWLIKGTYAKFEGIAGRNALIIHRTLAAIEGCEPEQLISSEILKLAISWTKFELNQTLSQYQLLAIDGTNPEQVRILKFIDKFKGQGWVNARAVSRWWTTKPIPSADKIRSFMTQVVSLGHAIDNGEPVDSAKYQIQIPEKSTDNTDKPPVSIAIKGFKRVGSSTDIGTDSTDKSTDNLDSGVDSTNGFKAVGNFVSTRSDNSKPLINGHLVDEPDKIVGSSTDTLNSIQNNNHSDFVSIVSTLPSNKNLKIGDRVRSGVEIFTIDRTEDGWVYGKTDDGDYIGAPIDRVELLPDDTPPGSMVIENDVVMEF